MGSEFSVRLPLASADVANDSVPAVSAPRPRARLPHGAKIVVIEDNQDSRDMLCEILGIAGYECHTAATGISGLALIDEVNPGVAIVDIGLPGIDGYEIARQLRAKPEHAGMWLIALTGYGQTADRATSRAAGFDEHFVKPVQTDDILRRLGEMHGPRSIEPDFAFADQA
jgi:two-component system CheB/CheR fusion protein